MTPHMTPALILDAPRSPTFATRLRLHRGQAIAGLGLGVLAEVFLDGAPFGLSVALFSIITALIFIAYGGREAWQTAGAHRWVLLGAVALMVSTVFHASTWFAVLSTIAAMLLASLAVLGWNGERSLASLRTGAVLAAPFKAVGLSIYGGAIATSNELGELNATEGLKKHGLPFARLLLIVAPPVLLLTFLLADADESFSERLDSIINALTGIPVDGFIRGTFVTAICGVVLTGALVLASRRKSALALELPRAFLKPFEAFTLLGALTATLFLYGSTPSKAGSTFSAAANAGFFQLLAAAIGIVVILMALPARTKLVTRRDFVMLKTFSTALVLAAIPMVLSGVRRLAIYETGYGLTRLRLLAYAGLLLMSAILAWRAFTSWVFEKHFVGGALALCTVTMLSLAALKPDRFIVERNLQRDVLDLPYMFGLSDDIVPPLLASDRLSDEYKQILRGDRRITETDPPLYWNLGMAEAASAFDGL